MRISFKLVLACLSLACATVALGLFALEGQRGLGTLAMKVYDDGVTSSTSARSAETKFADLRGRLAMTEQKQASADEMSAARTASAKELAAAKTASANELAAARTAAASELSAAKTESANELAAAKTASTNELAAARAASANELDVARAAAAKELAAARATAAKDMADLRAAAAKELAEVREAAAAETATAVAAALAAAAQQKPEAPAEPERQSLLDTRGAKMTNAVRPGPVTVRQAQIVTNRRIGAANRNDDLIVTGAINVPSIAQADVDKAVKAILDDLDVAIARAMSEDGARKASALRQSVQALSSDWKTPQAATKIDAVAGAFDQMVKQYTADGQQLRGAAEAMVAQGERSTLIAIGAAVAFALLVMLALGFTIVPALRRAAKFADNIADGNFDDAIALPKRRGRNETVALLAALSRMQTILRANTDRSEQLHAHKAETEQEQARLRQEDMARLADHFEAAVGEIIETVSSASHELEASATTLTATASQAHELTSMVAAASEEASSSVESVASATEEMASSVNEIGRQVHESARMANAAVDQARKTNDRVSDLSKAAARIGDVVELINTIAAQTNLLALNATIEAARAGQAGRGFAVVASEVKALAEQTAKATGEIGQQIAGIQAATEESVGAIRDISNTIERLSEISTTIASAVEQQGAATQEISRNVQQASIGTQQVTSNITNVQRGSNETGSASSQVLAAAQSLSSDSKRLKAEMARFLDSVRVA